MRKKLFAVIMLLILIFPLSASWKVGHYVDKFGDPTGRSCMFTLVENAEMSNTATVSSNAVVKVIIDIEADGRPRLDFQIHDYVWDNPMDSNIFQYVPKWSFKTQDGTVIDYIGDSRKWGSLDTHTSIELVRALMTSDYIKCYVSLGSSIYRFNIQSSNLPSLIKSLDVKVVLKEPEPEKIRGPLGPYHYDIILRSYGLGLTLEMGEENIIDHSSSYGASLGFEYYPKKTMGVVTSLEYFSNCAGSFVGFDIGMGVRMRHGNHVIGKFKFLFTLSYDLQNALYTKDEYMMNFGSGEGLSYTAEWHMTDHFYTIVGVGTFANFRYFEEYGELKTRGYMNLEIPLGIGFCF